MTIDPTLRGLRQETHNNIVQYKQPNHDNRPDFKGIETLHVLKSDLFHFLSFIMTIDPTLRGLRHLVSTSISIFSFVNHDNRPDFKGIETYLLRGETFTYHFYHDNRPDFKGIETLGTMWIAFPSPSIMTIDPTLRGLRQYTVNISNHALHYHDNRPDFKGIETTNL